MMFAARREVAVIAAALGAGAVNSGNCGRATGLTLEKAPAASSRSAGRGSVRRPFSKTIPTAAAGPREVLFHLLRADPDPARLPLPQRVEYSMGYYVHRSARPAGKELVA